MTTPSERVLSSWREHAKEDYWLHQLAGYRQKVMTGVSEPTWSPSYWVQVEAVQQKINETLKRMEDAKRFGYAEPPSHLWGGQ